MVTIPGQILLLIQSYSIPIHSLPPGDNYVSLDSESLSVLIEFSLSIGNINTILDCLLNLLGKYNYNDYIALCLLII